MHKKDILIVGLGSDILGDAGIGIKLLKYIQSNLSIQGIDFRTLLCGGFELLEVLNGYKQVIFIDSINSGKEKAGHIHFYGLENYRETIHLSNEHEVRLNQLFELGKSLRFDLPKKVKIIAVEIEEFDSFSESLSPTINEKYYEIRQKILNLVNTEVGSDPSLFNPKKGGTQ